MLEREVWVRVAREIKNLFPLFRYLVLQTETHAFCLALACAALLGFYPACLVLLALLKYIFHWNAAYVVLLETLRTYYPAGQQFLIESLEGNVARLGGRVELRSLMWILLGAAGVFIPLEAGLNRLWQVREDRPYWLNQIVGCTLTVVCVVLAVIFVAISTTFHFVVNILPFQVVRDAASYVVIHTTMTCFFIVTIFALYKFLPNKKVDAMQVLPAAILAGMIAELVRLIYALILPSVNIQQTQGPYFVSVSFVLLAYFETFVVLGGAFLATQRERYPWMEFLRAKAEVKLNSEQVPRENAG